MPDLVQLAINAEENHRYEEASRFRYCSIICIPILDSWTIH